MLIPERDESMSDAVGKSVRIVSRRDAWQALLISMALDCRPLACPKKERTFVSHTFQEEGLEQTTLRLTHTSKTAGSYFMAIVTVLHHSPPKHRCSCERMHSRFVPLKAPRV